MRPLLTTALLTICTIAPCHAQYTGAAGTGLTGGTAAY